MENDMMTLAGGRIRCRRCNAKSKRTLLQCGAPALRTKTKCRTHGGKSTGPRTEAGRQLASGQTFVHVPA